MLVLSHKALKDSFRSDIIVLNKNVLRAEDLQPRAIKLTLTNGMRYIIYKPCIGSEDIPCLADILVSYSYKDIINMGTCAAIQELEDIID
jgi:hypothetical protein